MNICLLCYNPVDRKNLLLVWETDRENKVINPFLLCNDCRYKWSKEQAERIRLSRNTCHTKFVIYLSTECIKALIVNIHPVVTTRTQSDTFKFIHLKELFEQLIKLDFNMVPFIRHMSCEGRMPYYKKLHILFGGIDTPVPTSKYGYVQDTTSICIAY